MQLSNIFKVKTKGEIEIFVKSIKSQILEGEIDLIEYAIAIKSASEFLKQLQDDKEIKEAIKNELEKYGKQSEIHGVKFSHSERKTYDFSGCKSTRWEVHKANEDAAKVERESVELWLKSLKDVSYDSVTGEEVFPPSYKSTEILSITLKK